ncbi:hypothetical protein FOCC_FOCC004685 [Frankliniella occidentalis]|uniref:RNA helicase n=1 Tax=Frankliniella occidentalis TaxID=133901 RepID=A0A9C6U2K5_FRAOC|nr:putative ATP-dependent RNA helicase TDRD12 [Frankliniella occidentalis]KAE8748672.1 hypothetical protein FOCC_FOCC004685 [Frankliniella occidentalis]
MASNTQPPHTPVVIHVFRSPSSAWCTEAIWDGMSLERKTLKDLESKIAIEVVKKKETTSFRDPGQMVAVQCPEDPRKWTRGRIKEKLSLINGPKYEVHMIDRGHTVRFKAERICNLPFNCDELPPQAMNIVLEGVVPVNLGISSAVDAMNPEISLAWTTRAENFVNEILKSQSRAWFVENADHPAIDQTHFGDLLIEIDNKTESLSDLLIQNGHAQRSSKHFEKRLQDERRSNLEGIRHSPRMVPWNDSSSSSCAPSPVTSLPSDSMSRKQTIGEVLKQQKMLKKSVDFNISGVSPEESSTSEGPKDHPTVSQSENDMKSTPKQTRAALLLSKLKGKSPDPCRVEQMENTNADQNSLDSNVVVQNKNSIPDQNTPDFLGIVATKESTQDHGIIEIPLPAISRKLDERFVPAGRSISSIRKTDSYLTHGLTKGCEPKKMSYEENNFNNMRTDCSSDSSSSDYKTETYMHTKTNGHLNSAGNSCDSSSDVSIQQPNRLSKAEIMNNLRKKRNSQSEVKEVQLSICENNQIKQIQPSQSSARDRILSATKLDDSTQLIDYIARSILLHGGFPPSPWVTYEQLKSKFSTHVEQLLIDRGWCYSILTLEKYMWPAIQQRQNVIMISPSKTGKTFSFIIPLMDFMIDTEIPKGNGPLLLILCSGSKAAVEVYESCVKVVNGAKRAPRVQIAHGQSIGADKIFKLINGCEVLVTTPPCLLRILKHEVSLNFKRLCHYVLDQADILMTKFLNEMKEIQALVVAEQESRTMKNAKNGNDESDPIQIIVSSEKWEPHFPSYSKHLRGNPLLCINDCFEACVYGKPEVAFHLTRSKITKLLQILKNVAGLNKVVVFCQEDEIDTLEAFLRNECLDVLVSRPNLSLQQLNAIMLPWKSSKEGQHYTLLCTDSEFIDLKIHDAMCVVNFSFPSEDRSLFVKRLSSIHLNLPNIFERKTQVRSPSIQLILDESNAEQMPVIVQLMQRISDNIPKDIMELAENVRKEREKMKKINKIFCLNLKMFGDCTKSNCPSRHVFIPELDSSNILPGDGLVKVLVSKVRSAGHFSVRLEELIRPDKRTEIWNSQYTKIAFKMFNHFSKPENRKLIDSDKVAVGDVYAMETIENLFHRVQVLEVLEKDKNNHPSVVQVKFLDEGEQKDIKVYCLYALPEELKVLPAEIVDVFLCGLLPADRDDGYDRDATSFVKKCIKFVEDSPEDSPTFVQGQVVLSMTGSLWLDPVGVCEWLPNTGTTVVRQNIKRSLLEKGHAIENLNHLPKLFALCGKEIPKPLLVQDVSRNVCKPHLKPNWAFLESETSEEVEFICAEVVEGVTLFYVQRTKFKPLLTNLIDEINKDTSKRKEEEVLSLTPGDICLAKYEQKWQRAKMLSINDNTASVFYVDYGDDSTVSLEELKSIPEWAITKLPFQAIECSLAGISSISCDLLYDITDDGAKELFAQVCNHKSGKTTGGKHFVVALIDPVTQSILNEDLLKLEGVEKCADELKYLNFQIDQRLFSQRNESGSELALNENDKLDVNDLEFQDEDISHFYDDDDDEDDDDEVMKGFEEFELEGLEQFLEKSAPLRKAYEDAQGALINKSNQAVTKSLSPVNNEINYESINQEMNQMQEDGNLSDWEEEGNFVGRCKLPVLCNARPPRTKWLEDLYYVWIKICITGVEKYFLHWTYDTIQFCTTVGGRHYLLDQKLRGTILPSNVKSSVKGFTVEVKMKKAHSGMDWGRPFASQRRLPWVSRDLEATADASSDSDCEVSLGTINKEIRKLPLKMRRKRLSKQMKGTATKPDLGSSSEDSNYEHEQGDSDEMF